MADHGLSPIEEAHAALAEDRNASAAVFQATGIVPRESRVARALRALLATTREDNAPESIAHEVIARRYGSYATFEIALRLEGGGLSPLGILNMLKDAAAAGLDSRDEF